MDLQILINPTKAEGHPFEMFIVGLIYSVLSVALSLLVFPSQASIIMVTIAVVASVPIVYNIFSLESNKGSLIQKEYSLLKEHEKAVKTLTFLFFGFVAGFFAWFVFLEPARAQAVFNTQLSAIVAVNTPTGNFYAAPVMIDIFLNNIKILFFTLIFSLFFGAGGIFILSWNASVMATAIGLFVRKGITGSIYSMNALGVFTAALLRYLPHGVFEIIAYFLAGLAGGIIYNAILRKQMTKHVFFDSGVLVITAILFLVVAVVIEVFMTPTLVS